jgi:hypothetical protein
MRKKEILHLKNIWDRKKLIRDRDRNWLNYLWNFHQLDNLRLQEQHLDRVANFRATHSAPWHALLAPFASISLARLKEGDIQLGQCYKPEAEQEEEGQSQEAEVKAAQAGPRLQRDQLELLQEEREQEGRQLREEQEGWQEGWLHSAPQREHREAVPPQPIAAEPSHHERRPTEKKSFRRRGESPSSEQ